jgi:DNA-binding MarR family transcriptional regulator
MISEMDDNLDLALQMMGAEYLAVLRERLKAAVSSAGDQRTITPEQYAILMVLDRNKRGMAVMDIAEEIASPHANVSRTLDRLEHKGLVGRGRGKEDGRQVVVKLTLEGGKVVGTLRQVAAQVHRRIWGRYSEEEKGRLLSLLNKT